MSDDARQIIGLEKDILVKDFHVSMHFHVLCQYAIDLRTSTSSATFAGYASRAAFDAGGRPLIHTSAQIPCAPKDCALDRLPTWFAMQLLTVASGHDFVGATPVYADAVPASQEPAA